MTVFLFVLMALAAFRLTRLITRDKLPLFHAPREAFAQRWGSYEDAQRQRNVEDPRWQRPWRWLFACEFESVNERNRTSMFMKSLAYLWECDWCMGIWVSGGVVYTTVQFADVPLPYLQWLAAAALVGLIAAREEPKKA